MFLGKLEKRLKGSNNLEFEIDKNIPDSEKYDVIERQLEFFILPEDKLISNLSNFTALLKESFSKISWVGFYHAEKDKLFLGTFQGNSACTEIKIGEGVCGTSAKNGETIIVEDVDKFPGHIVCDSKSKSEIVVPIFVNEKIWGVLDIDSYEKKSFGELDKKYLEKFCNFLSEKLDLEKFILI